MKFNENLKYLRKKEGLTQEQLAEKLNVSRQAVTKWESGQALPDIVNLKEIAVLFGVTTDELLGDKKTTSATSLDKKLKELPAFLIWIGLMVVYFIFETQLQDMPLLLVLLILFVIIPLSGILIVKGLKSKPAIIDMSQTKKGKRARLKYVLKDATIFTSIFLGIDLLIYIIRVIRGLEIYTPIHEILLDNCVFFGLILICSYSDLKSKMKKYNK